MRCLTCKAEVESGRRECDACGVPMDEIPNGTIIGEKYRITGRIGSGGMGRVYVAEHLILGRRVAVKVLHHKYLGKRDLKKRFKSEALAASQMNHPNVVPVHDFGQDSSGQLFIVMDYVEGRSLEAALVSEWPLGDARVLHIAIQILRALEEAHSHGILHRDLKPENVMLEDRQDQVDQVHVLDFGLAKAVGAQGLGDISKITAAGSTCGTPEYMSPEQAQGTDLDARSDLYSLGVLMYRMVVGRPPFTDANPISVAARHVTDNVPPMRSVASDATLHPDLEAAIYRALSKQRTSRFEDASAMRTCLVDILTNLRGGGPLVASLDSSVPEDLDTEEYALGKGHTFGGDWGPTDPDPTTPDLLLRSGMPPARSRLPERLGVFFAGFLLALALVAVWRGSVGARAQDDVLVLRTAGPGVEVRPNGGLWMAAKAPRRMAEADRLRVDGGGLAELEIAAGVTVEAQRAEFAVDADGHIDLRSGRVTVRHRGGGAPAARVRVSAALGEVEIAQGQVQVGAVEAAGLSVVNHGGTRANLHTPNGEVPVEPQTEVRYTKGQKAVSKPIQPKG